MSVDMLPHENNKKRSPFIALWRQLCPNPEPFLIFVDIGLHFFNKSHQILTFSKYKIKSHLVEVTTFCFKNKIPSRDKLIPKTKKNLWTSIYIEM